MTAAPAPVTSPALFMSVAPPTTFKPYFVMANSHLSSRELILASLGGVVAEFQNPKPSWVVLYSMKLRMPSHPASLTLARTVSMFVASSIKPRSTLQI